MLASPDATAGLLDRFRRTRALSVALAAPLSDADATAQSMPDASPAKWHLAHTTWFLETFVLRDHVVGYDAFDPRFAFLFNSYYEAEGARHARPARGLLTRPALAEVLVWREHVDAALEAAWQSLPPAALELIELGIQHEQQHQELLLTDLLHLFAQNPLGPAMFRSSPLQGRWQAKPDGGAGARSGPSTASRSPSPSGGGLDWRDHPGGIVRVGHEGPGFAFDCEGPSHEVLLRPFRLASRCVTNAEWDAFVAYGGYRTASLWLSDGWDWVRREAITGPLYWRDEQREFTLVGERDRDPNAPVAHISFYEADAFAAWAGVRLPTEFEWETAAEGTDAVGGNQLDAAGPVAPVGSDSLFGDVWQWTASAFRPYPGFRPAAGAVGEYNGKFMSGQMVLKGASCATPRGHSRASYRNFFPPSARWQFSGARLAQDG